MSFEPTYFVEFAERLDLRHELSHFSKLQLIEQFTRLPTQLKCKIYGFGMQSSKGMKIELILFQAFSAFHWDKCQTWWYMLKVILHASPSFL